MLLFSGFCSKIIAFTHIPVGYAKNTCRSASPAASLFQMAETAAKLRPNSGLLVLGKGASAHSRPGSWHKFLSVELRVEFGSRYLLHCKKVFEIIYDH